MKMIRTTKENWQLLVVTGLFYKIPSELKQMASWEELGVDRTNAIYIVAININP